LQDEDTIRLVVDDRLLYDHEIRVKKLKGNAKEPFELEVNNVTYRNRVPFLAEKPAPFPSSPIEDEIHSLIGLYGVGMQAFHFICMKYFASMLLISFTKSCIS
jgi:hypothetical protein